MEKRTCPNPNCGKEVAPYNQFCPHCDVDLPRHATPKEGIEAHGDKHKTERPEKPVGAADFVAEKRGDEVRVAKESMRNRSQPAVGLDENKGLYESEHGRVSTDTEREPADQVKVCTKCFRFVPFEFRVCNKCGGELAKSLDDIAGGGGSGAPKGDVIPSSALSGKAILDPGMQGASVSPPRAWALHALPPVILHFNAGRNYYKGSTSFLEFILTGNYHATVESLDITIETRLMDQVLQGKVLAPVLPGSAQPTQITGFRPSGDGEDTLQIHIKGTIKGMDVFHLRGSIPVRVLQSDEPETNVKFDFTGGKNIYFPKEAIEELYKKQLKIQQSSVARWVQVDLFWDHERQEREARFFPNKCMDPSCCLLDKTVLSSLRSLSPEIAPVAVLSAADGTAYFMIPGKTLLLGRDEDACHVSLRLFGRAPDSSASRSLGRDTYSPENQRISRNHCQIFIRDNRIFIRDTSANGTCIEGRAITPYEDVPLANDDVILFPNSLELQIKLFTDGADLIAVRLVRLNNKTNHQYVLAYGPVPIGASPELPVCIPGGQELCGNLYYNPQVRAWFFRKPDAPSGGQLDMKLEEFKELDFGAVKCWFSTS
jgi:hypothetical protein